MVVHVVGPEIDSTLRLMESPGETTVRIGYTKTEAAFEYYYIELVLWSKINFLFACKSVIIL